MLGVYLTGFILVFLHAFTSIYVEDHHKASIHTWLAAALLALVWPISFSIYLFNKTAVYDNRGNRV